MSKLQLLTNCADRKSERESQTRPLLSLEPAHAQAVWQRAVEESGECKLTASRVNAALRELQPPTSNLALGGDNIDTQDYHGRIGDVIRIRAAHGSPTDAHGAIWRSHEDEVPDFAV